MFRTYLLCSILLLPFACSKAKKTLALTNLAPPKMKVIGYYASWSAEPDSLHLEGLTHINYSFAIPAKTGNVLQPIEEEAKLRRLVALAHKNGQKVFLAVGGWDIEDGGGNDNRFHKIAETESNRQSFVKSIMEYVKKYELDGIDMDWEYPDENTPSADHYVLLMHELAQALHAQKKELSAAVVAYGEKGAGIKSDVFSDVDWLNLMAYDDDNGIASKAHSPYELAEKCLDYWINERKLPASKANLGLPFYGKPYLPKQSTDYKALLKWGANPQEDSFKGVFYNGIPTIQKKVKLAQSRGCGGVMIWEIAADTQDENSLIRAINQAIH